jgi:single-strand DNA-binding protein
MATDNTVTLIGNLTDDHVTETLAKGARAIVIGRLRLRSWETDEGERRSLVEVVADQVAPR